MTEDRGQIEEKANTKRPHSLSYPCSVICHLSSVLCSLIRHEFKQRPVGIAKIHAGALAFGAVAFHRSKFDRDPLALQMCNSIGDRSLPLEADVAIAGLYRQASNDHAAHAG